MKEKFKVRIIARAQIFMVEGTVRKKIKERKRKRELPSLVAVIAESSLT